MSSYLSSAIVIVLVFVAPTGKCAASNCCPAMLPGCPLRSFRGLLLVRSDAIPLYIFIFLAALGVDYNIFLSARIREESRRAGTPAGTLRGLTLTGSVITAAGVILAATFTALAQLPSVSVTEVGTAIAIGVLLDTLLVRTVLVPAILITIGNRIWWPGPRPADTEPA